MMSIRLNRTIARVEIGKRIDWAEKLLESLRRGSVKTYDDFEQAHASLLSLSGDVESRVRTMFDEGEELTAEWQSLEIGIIDDGSRPHNLRRLASSTGRGIAWLTRLRNRLDEMPQSPRTPVATWGR